METTTQTQPTAPQTAPDKPKRERKRLTLTEQEERARQAMARAAQQLAQVRSRQSQQARKDRDHALILLGLALADLLALSPEEKQPAWTAKALACFEERRTPAPLTPDADEKTREAHAKAARKHQANIAALEAALQAACAGNLS